MFSAARIPKLTLPFAYFLGYLLGDGYTSRSGHPLIGMTCHSIDEREYCMTFLVPLIVRTFGIHPCVYKKKNQNAIAITFGSEKVLTYLTRELGVPLGQERKTVPKWIIEASMKVKIAFIRGLFDADGSLIFSKKHHQTEVYPSIELKSVDQEILEWVQRTLWELSFRATLGRSVESYVLRINGEEMLKRWMDVIGSSNIKHISKFQVWRRFGYCPPSTKVPDRIRFLKQGAIDL